MQKRTLIVKNQIPSPAVLDPDTNQPVSIQSAEAVERITIDSAVVGVKVEADYRQEVAHDPVTGAATTYNVIYSFMVLIEVMPLAGLSGSSALYLIPVGRSIKPTEASLKQAEVDAKKHFEDLMSDQETVEIEFKDYDIP